MAAHVRSAEITVTGMTSVAVFDFSFDRRAPNLDRALVELDVANQQTELWRRYDDSFAWNFYRRSKDPGDQLAESLPGTHRFVFPPGHAEGGDEAEEENAEGEEGPQDRVAVPLDAGSALLWSASALGWTLLLSPDYGAGVATFWSQLDSPSGPRSLRETIAVRRAVEDSGPLLGQLVGQLENVGLAIGEIERHYPFTALRLASPAVARDALTLPQETTAELGRLFTGAEGWEEPAWLSAYVAPSENLSRRSYERLFLRWTDALALYDTGLPGPDDSEYVGATGRAVQILETCVLVRRILRNINIDIERAAGRVSALEPRLVWRTRGELLDRFTNVERAYMIAPPFQSSEGERLLESTYERFGVDELFTSTRHSYDQLERRLGMVESQYVLVAGVITFIVNAVVAIAF